MGAILYTDSKHHVSLSLPPSDSKICKDIGLTASANFLIPTMDYIIQCATKGDLGIADNIKKTKSVQNLNKCTNPDTLKFLANSLGVSLAGDPEKYRKNGKYSIPDSEISLSVPGEDVGLKMIEKTAIKAILDQYKPWIEIAKIMIQHLAQVEDVIARIVALSIQSEKPKGNGGSGDTRPKALGYKGAVEMKQGVGRMNSLDSKMKIRKDKKKKKDDMKLNGGGGNTDLNTSNASGSTNPDGSNRYEYTIVSTVYSTGVFKEGVDYIYEYIDLEDDSLGELDDNLEGGGIDMEDNDPYRGLRPKSMIFGIYDSKGNVFSPTSPIRSFEIDQNGSVKESSLADLDVGIEAGTQKIQKADWLLRTGRWFGDFPRFGVNGSFVYVYKQFGSIYNGYNTLPKDNGGYTIGGYKQQFYQDKDRNWGDDATDSNGQTNPPVLFFDNSEKDTYRDLFSDIIDSKFNKTPPGEVITTGPYPVMTGLSSSDRVGYKAKIMSMLDTQVHLENMSQNGFLPSLRGNILSSNGSGIFEINNRLEVKQTNSVPLIGSYKARKLNINGKDIWIDPETDYDMKVIQIDHSSKIKFKDDSLQGSPEVEAEILRFVKTSIDIEMYNTSTAFDIDVIRRTSPSPQTPWEPYVVFQTSTPGRYENLTQFTMDNWNYKDPDSNLSTPNEKLFLGMEIMLRVSSKIPTKFWSTKSVHTWSDDTNYILGKIGENWKIGKYTDETETDTVKNWSYSDITEIPFNDPIVSKIKVRDIAEEKESSYDVDKDTIVSWFFNGTWSGVPPSTWYKSPLNNSGNTFMTYQTSEGDIPDVIGDPGNEYINILTTYDVTAIRYPKDDSNNKTFGLTGSNLQRYKIAISRETTTRKFLSIPFEQDDSNFSNKGLPIGSRYSLPDGSYAYFNSNTYEINKWEYLFFNSTDPQTNLTKVPILVGKKFNWVIDYNLIGDNNTQPALTATPVTIPPNQIRLKENNNPFGRLLDPRKITNDHLAEDNPIGDRYSNGQYGSPSSGNPQRIERLFRYMKSEFDTETYFIVEGILSDTNSNPLAGGPNGNSSGSGAGGGSGYYGKPQSLGAIKVFISMLTDVFSKLIPSIKTLIELFKDPTSFLVEIIKDKLKDVSLIFSTDFFSDLKKLEGITDPIKKKEFGMDSSLGEYVYVNPITGDHRVLFDGAAIKKLGPLFGATLTFGIEVKKAVPKLIFKIDLASLVSNSLDSILNGTAKDKNLSALSSNQSDSTINKSNGSSSNPPVESILDGESVTITYSTGVFIEGIKYQYIYLTEYVSNLVKDADVLAESGDPDQMNLALSKYDAALQEDPNNQLIQDRLNNLMNKIPNFMQAIMDLLLAMVSGPLVLIANVVQFIMDFFQNMNFGTLPEDVVKFVSFSWLIKKDTFNWTGLEGGFFSPSAIFEIFGLDTIPIPGMGNPSWDTAAALFATYTAGAIPDAPNMKKPVIPGMPVRNGSIDLNKAISFSFAPFMKRPSIENSPFPVGVQSLSKDHILTMFKKLPSIKYDEFKLVGIPPLIELVAQFICFIESIINAIIDLFWSILGLEVLIPPPHINLCKKFSANNMKPRDIMDLLNGNYKDNLASGDTTDTDGDGKPDYDFIYEIKTSDGKDIRELNKEDLQTWLDQNSGYDFEFLFNADTEASSLSQLEEERKKRNK